MRVEGLEFRVEGRGFRVQGRVGQMLRFVTSGSKRQRGCAYFREPKINPAPKTQTLHPKPSTLSIKPVSLEFPTGGTTLHSELPKASPRVHGLGFLGAFFKVMA